MTSAPDARPGRPLVRRPALGDCIAAVRHPDIYRNFAIHLFVMLPAAVVMCALASAVDRAHGWRLPMPAALGAAAGLAAIGAGGAWVVYVYGYLYLSGGGSPGTHVDGGPSALVDTGPYTLVRHPSVLGKLAGVIGLGLIARSPTFLFGFVPVLVVYALLTNRYLQERFCDQRFGARYQRYRQAVPMLLPRPSGLLRWWNDEAAVPDDAPRPEGTPAPPGSRHELRAYLVGLVLLITLFAGIAAWLGAA